MIITTDPSCPNAQRTGRCAWFFSLHSAMTIGCWDSVAVGSRSLHSGTVSSRCSRMKAASKRSQRDVVFIVPDGFVTDESFQNTKFGTKHVTFLGASARLRSSTSIQHTCPAGSDKNWLTQASFKKEMSVPNNKEADYAAVIPLSNPTDSDILFRGVDGMFRIKELKTTFSYAWCKKLRWRCLLWPIVCASRKEIVQAEESSDGHPAPCSQDSLTSLCFQFASFGVLSNSGIYSHCYCWQICVHRIFTCCFRILVSIHNQQSAVLRSSNPWYPLSNA